MAASSTLLLWCGFISLLVCCWAESFFPVPVFIWSKDSELSSISPVLAGHTVKEKDFREKYLNRLFQAPQVIAVFLQDRLSIDDISHYGDAYSSGNHGAAFSNLKVAMETANSTAVLPSVELTSSSGKSDELVHLIREMTSGLVKEFTQEESSSFNIKEFSVDQEKTNVFIFHLMPTSSSTPEEIFIQNDKLIGAITQKISSTGLPYSCILTAAAPSEAVYERHLVEERSNMAHDRLRRATADASSSPLINGSLFVDAGCILMYFKGFLFKYSNATHDIFNMTGLEYSFTPNCEDDNTTDSVVIRLKMKGVNIFDLSFSFFTNGTNGEWSCSKASLDVDGTFENEKITGNISYSCGDVLMGPTQYSYSCGNVTLKKDNSTSFLSFKQFQVQPFNVPNGTFAYAYDCTGFFTIPIFMGLITGGVLLLILFIGVLAMFSLTTMDRFDDPKGPTIHVPTG